MPERIYKLQPNRTLALRGFDDLGASAAVHSATATSFRVSGVFRDPADFAVLMLHDADNFYEHPRLKYLPEFDFTGLVLQFDVHYSGLMPLDSPKYSTIDWPYLDIIRKDETTVRIRLYDPDPAKTHAVRVAGDQTCAEAAFTIEDNGLREYDRLTLWYLNLAFDYIVPKLDCSFAFKAGTAGKVHTVTVAGVVYSYTQQGGDSDAAVALGVASALAACPHVTAQRDPVYLPQVNIHAKRDDGIAFDVSDGQTTYLLHGVGAAAVAQDLARQINAANWNAAGALIPLRASASGAQLRVTAQTPGHDGNMLAIYSVAKNDNLRTTEPYAKFSGGSSDVTWRVTLDFAALGVPQIRQMWLTFAPPLADGTAFDSTEWEAVFANWAVTGPEDRRTLNVAAPGTVRVEETDSWCSYTGTWTSETGFYSSGAAKCTSDAGATLTVKYHSARTHDLYLGTSLYSDRGSASVSLDGIDVGVVNCRLSVPAQVNTRRLLRSGVAAGEHRVVIRYAGGGPFYFDFLEAAVPGDVPDAPPPDQTVSPALDYSTDHTYKLPPARIHWMFDKLGYAAPMNEYIGVFWWNQRRRVAEVIPQIAIKFQGTFAAGDGVFLKIGDAEIGKSVFPADTNASIARHFAQFLNSQSVAVWATVEDTLLTIRSRSPKEAYLLPASIRKESPTGSSGSWDGPNGSLLTGDPGRWEVDANATPPINRGARDWHADMFRECASRNREIVVAASMELVNPPDTFASVFRDDKPVITDVGFGKLKSTHCAFTPPVLAFQQSVFRYLADLMSQASLTPNLQCGEFLWWFFTDKTPDNPAGGMGFYHPDVKEAAQAALGRPLHGFAAPVDDPSVNNGADAAFLRSRLRDHVAGIVSHVRAAHPNAKIEVLFPYDVNHPEPAGVHNLGGRLNRYVNFPKEWESKAACGFDRLKTEALDFGAWSRNLDLARTAFQFPLDLGWPADYVRHLVPVFRPDYPWEKEVAMAKNAGVPVVNLWAFDHVCIYGWPVTKESTGRSSFNG